MTRSTMRFAWMTIATVGALMTGTGLTACSSADADSPSVGISMPTRSLERWIRDGEDLQSGLAEKGLTADLQYADNKTDQQISQIQNMIASGSKVLVVAAVDGGVLAPVLEEAKRQDITVIAYDRLITGTSNVDYYATFDNYRVGQMQGEYIEKSLGLAEGKGPFNLEPFAGSPDDNNARFFFNGAWDVLSKYVDKGQLVVPSGKTAYANIGILEWKSSTAQAELENRLSTFYGGGKKLDVVLSPNDSLAIGIQAALKSAGYRTGVDWPLVTGQDADLANVKAMLAGQQSMDIWKDTRALGERVVTMVDQVLNGQTVETNNNTDYDTGSKIVPSVLLEPQIVTPENTQAVLVDSGFYTAEQLK